MLFRRASLVMLILALLAGAAAAAPLAAPAASRPLTTGVADGDSVYGPEADLAFRRIRQSGAQMVRLTLKWTYAAARQPASPEDPGDPAYQFGFFDRQVRLAVANGLTPIVNLTDVPAWAAGDGGSSISDPNPVEFGRFAAAVARRYSGSFGGLPRVSYYEGWNEPNASFFLTPQFDGGRPRSPAIYRELIRNFAEGVYGVSASNVVVGGATFPLGYNRPDGQAVSPLAFMREVFCLDANLAPQGDCGPPLRLDVWSHHPYTSGGPTHAAFQPDDVSLGDLGDMKRVLDAARKAGRLVSPKGPPGLWITEFTWDSSPPDNGGVPVNLLKRWVPEAMYRAWTAGVSMFMWYLVEDEPMSKMFQSGLYYDCEALACAKPKPFLAAFRFPFVAVKAKRGRAIAWGRTPDSRAARVFVEQRSGGRYVRLATLKADGSGIFTKRVTLRGKGKVRARVAGGGASVPFSPARTKDRPGTTPFGSQGG